MSHSKKTQRQHMWEQMQNSASFTSKSIGECCNVSPKNVAVFVRCLLDKHCISRQEGIYPPRYVVIPGANPQLGRGNNKPSTGLSVREKAWQAMIQTESFTMREIADKSGLSGAAATALISYLQKQKRVIVIHSQQPWRYKVIDASPFVFGKGKHSGPPRRHKKKQKPRQKMWNAIRMLRKVTIKELAGAANITKASANTFLTQLERTGYMRKIHTGGNHRGARSIWMLIRDTGPLYPIDRRHQGMFDVNEQRLYPFVTTKKEVSNG